jgi:osmoprotectant transport system permease protein
LPRPPAYTFVFKKPSNWQWLWEHKGYFLTLSRTHLYLALVAVLIGLVLSLPIGILAVRVRRTYVPILAVTTLIYSIPSLAAFAFLVSVTGLSDNTVILPLAGYSLAILVRSVADGLHNVPEEVRVAATAMGYRPLRRLLTVELPSAVPVIIAGLRIATVSSISLVTVGSLIGIGALGVLFTDGENTGYKTEILAGVVIVAFWALLLDGLLLLAGRLLAPWARATS